MTQDQRHKCVASMGIIIGDVKIHHLEWFCALQSAGCLHRFLVDFLVVGFNLLEQTSVNWDHHF